jgi:hypothetical protein
MWKGHVVRRLIAKASPAIALPVRRELT